MGRQVGSECKQPWIDEGSIGQVDGASRELGFNGGDGVIVDRDKLWELIAVRACVRALAHQEKNITNVVDRFVQSQNM